MTITFENFYVVSYINFLFSIIEKVKFSDGTLDIRATYIDLYTKME